MFKTLLVHLRGTTGDRACLAAALPIAQAFKSHLEGFYVRPNLAELVARTMSMNQDLTLTTEMMETLRQQSNETAERSFLAFAEFCEHHDIPRAEIPQTGNRPIASLRERMGDEVKVLIEQSRYYDLLVVKGGYAESGGLSVNELGRLVTSSGRPILLAPTSPARPINTVLIAWKDAPEAARALTAALPVLQQAQNVFVVTAGEDDEPMADCEKVVRYLSWYNVTASAHHIPPRQRTSYDAILETARANDVDLLVTGAYGHHRLAEFVFGGFTQGMFDDASLPVLFLH